MLSTSVENAVWNDESQTYTVTLRDVRTGNEYEEVAEMVVDATGGLSIPAFPADVKDKETFAGEQFHSARWRKEVVLSEKRVGVVGNGCSACVQLKFLIHVNR